MSSDSEKNAADILGIHVDSDINIIKKAFRKKALHCHPDKKTGNTEAFQELTDAYNTLLDSKNNPKISICINPFENDIEKEADELYHMLNELYTSQSSMFSNNNNIFEIENIEYKVRIDIKDIWNNIEKKYM